MVIWLATCDKPNYFTKLGRQHGSCRSETPCNKAALSNSGSVASAILSQTAVHTGLHGVHSRCTMTDHDMMPVAAEAGANMKRLALQIHENTISCAAIAGYQLYARALQIHVLTYETAQPGLGVQQTL